MHKCVFWLHTKKQDEKKNRPGIVGEVFENLFFGKSRQIAVKNLD